MNEGKEQFLKKKYKFKCPCGETTFLIQSFPNHYVGCIVHTEGLQKEISRMKEIIKKKDEALKKIKDREHFSEYCNCDYGDNGYCCYRNIAKEALEVK